MRFDQIVSFAGFNWQVKDSEGQRTGPGDNIFSPECVSVGDEGLRLEIKRIGSVLACGEVICSEALGLGEYNFSVEVRELAENTIFGLFTWEWPSTEDFNRELDIEISRFGDGQLQCQHLVQSTENDHVRFRLPEGPSTHAIQWLPFGVNFKSSAVPFTKETAVRDKVPLPGNARVDMNLWRARWLRENGKSYDAVIIRDFLFQRFP